MPKNPICNYCNTSSSLVTGEVVYPHREDLWNKHFYYCNNNHDPAYVGCHPNTTTALGRLANSELRALKSKAHKAFDPLWKSGKMTRKQAYTWLADNLNIPDYEAHIGMFDEARCLVLIKLIKESYL
jgi:hypothetical protein